MEGRGWYSLERHERDRRRCHRVTEQARTHIEGDVPAPPLAACNRSLSATDQFAAHWLSWGSLVLPYLDAIYRTKPTNKCSQSTTRITRSSRKCNQELLPVTVSNQGNVVPPKRSIIIYLYEGKFIHNTKCLTVHLCGLSKIEFLSVCFYSWFLGYSTMLF